MSLAFQAGQNNWATLQVMDETEQRKWSDDDQLLVKQVADQLSLALENARLFQETQRRARRNDRPCMRWDGKFQQHWISELFWNELPCTPGTY